MYSKIELKAILKEERELYLFGVSGDKKKAKRIRHKRYYIWKYLYLFRLSQYYNLKKSHSRGIKRRIYRMITEFYNRRKNICSSMAGVEIGNQCKIGRCVDIWHGGVVINGEIGDGCIFHGNNIVGNKGYGGETLQPILGEHVDVGAGASIIGDVSIANNCIIGAGAVVVKSESRKGMVLVGVPAKPIKCHLEDERKCTTSFS